MKKVFLIAVFLLPASRGITQEGKAAEYLPENYLRYQDEVYQPNIKTPLLYREGWELGHPLLALNSNDRLVLSFDDLDGGVRQYQYAIIHCNADWLPSGLMPHEYLGSYVEDYIEDYAFSYNTLQAYTNYQLVFPNDRVQIKLSGNYLLYVYPENEKDKPVLSCRFWVVDSKVRISAEVRRPLVIEDKNEKQQLLFKIFTGGYQIVSPFQNLKVILRQNGRWDNLVSDLQPMLAKGDELDYYHSAGNIFHGGNEFRHVDLKTVKYPTDRVQKIMAGSPVYEIFLIQDERRPFKVYITEDDINGRFLIRTQDGTTAATEADYVKVHFSLPYFPMAADGNIYLLGGLTNWQLSKEARMTYNFSRKAYETSLYLKQGYYNYLYLFQENGLSQGDFARVEGNHHETRNEYTIYVYYQEPGKNYQQLIGLETINSK